jgi:hypothetical protein
MRDFDPSYDRSGSSASRRCALDACGMSALLRKRPDCCGATNFRFVPIATIMRRSKKSLLNHLVGQCEQRIWQS